MPSPVEIPQLNYTQLGLLKDMCNLHRLAIVIPDNAKDSPNDYARFMDTNMAVDGLMRIGLIEDITELDETRPFMEALLASGRFFRVFAPNKIGRAMLNEENCEWKN